MLCGLLEDGQLWPQTGLQGHDNGFTQGINRRVGHLSKLLTEVVIDTALTLGQHGHRGIIAHGAYGFLAALGQNTQDLVTLFKGQLIELLHRA